VFEEFMLEAGDTTKGRDLWLEVRRIRSGASRNRLGDVVWLDFKAPHRHLVVDVTVTSARHVDRLAILVAVRRFRGMGAAYFRSTITSACNISFADILLSLFTVFGGCAA
jgi:hypothetical protein